SKAARIAMPTTATPTPIPAFAPELSAVDEDDGGGIEVAGVGEEIAEDEAIVVAVDEELAAVGEVDVGAV
ncbi:MAG: hypothetical protein Q9226_006862, partial [Calogaya cf. arnoldii]